ncbi:MAG: exodeoxyribonuclease VII large subunit [Planctomycetota bacterium]|jgi:exodeoxyribonuclease VII large subunit
MTREPFNPNLIRVPPEERLKEPGGPLTVSQVTALVKRAIESTLPATLHVVGEISNFKRHSSGHLYLTLKDRSSELSCVMWRSAAAKLKFSPSDGLEVIATGNVEVFERAGRYQLYIRKLEPRGVGTLELAFRQLCEKLEGEGLFDKRHKQPLPAYPARIALVTSPTGAAVADMLRTIQRRYPCVHVLVYPVRVQGPGAAAEIATAVRRVNANAHQLGGVDLMIVGRGGGSLEDLWAFNEEIVARAIHASRIPVVSAVGHEVDVSIADLVADVRAATPTAAAEIAVPVLDEVLEGLTAYETRPMRALRTKMVLSTTRLSAALQRAAFRDPLTMTHRREQVIDEWTNRLHRSLTERVNAHRRKVDRLEPIVQRIAPHAVMLRTTVKHRDLEHRLRWAMSNRLARATASVVTGTRRLERASPEHVLKRLSQRLQGLADGLPATIRYRLALLHERVRRNEELLGALSYKSVVGRGFSVTRIKKGRRIVRSVEQLKDRDRIVTELADAEFEADVVNLIQRELFD